MKKSILRMLSIAGICAMSFTHAWAADAKKESVTVDPKEKAELARKADLFLKLVSYGEAEKSPLIMLSAVKVIDDLPFKAIEKAGEKGAEGTKYDRDAVLKQAKAFAEGDAELLALIAKVEAAPEKIEVRGHHDRYGRGPGYYGGHHYYERRYHRRHYHCVWFINRYGDWVCR